MAEVPDGYGVGDADGAEAALTLGFALLDEQGDNQAATPAELLLTRAELAAVLRNAEAQASDGLLTASRGAAGGFTLSREPAAISVA